MNTFPQKEFTAPEAQAVLDAIPSLVFVKDAEGRFVIVNQAFADFFARPKEQIHGMSDLAFKHTIEQLSYFQEMDKRVLETRQPIVIPLEFATNAKGEPVPLTTHKVPCGEYVLGISTPLGVSSGLGGLFSEILDKAPQGIYVKDKDRRYILVNRELLRLLGKQHANELLGKTLEDTGHEYAEKARDEDLKVLKFGAPVIGRCRVVASSVTGEVKTLQTNKHPVKDSADRVVGLIGFVEDVSQMQRFHSQLVWKDFTAGLAHQLKNRLFTFETNFRSLSDELVEDQSVPVRNLLFAMEGTISELKVFMNQVGSRVKMQSGLSKITNVGGVVRKALTALHTTIPVSEDVQDDLWAVVDPTSLGEAVLELAINALKQLQERGRKEGSDFQGAITVRVEPGFGQIQGHEQELVRIVVSDNGYGVALERKTLIFQGALTTTSTGWGVGLTHVREAIVDRSGGNLYESGVFGEGASFVIELKSESLFEKLSA